MGKEKIHYEAPNSNNIPLLMKQFLDWVNDDQKGDLDITDWLEWSLNCLEAALLSTEQSIETVLQKAVF